jgi:hypothetical protein
VVGIDANANKYLLDGYCHRMRLSERWEKLSGLHRKWANMPGIGLLSVGYERYGAQSDDEYFDEKMRNTPDARFHIETLSWTGEQGGESKKHRVERLEPDFRDGNFFLPGKVWHPAAASLLPEDASAEERVVERARAGTTAVWHVAEDSAEIIYRPYTKMNPLEREVRSHGQEQLWRVIEPLRRLDEDGNIYDLTRVFFEEYGFFPFSPRKDLIDATSRIYDMEPMPPPKPERGTETEDYPDS